jgi:gluconate 2-dehydrogenase
MLKFSSAMAKVLRLGKVEFAHDKWAQLAQKAQVVECTSKDRQQFFEDLKGKYSDITHITRTFASVAQTGRFDAELAANLPLLVKCIAHCGAGYDQIDVGPFSERKIQISNVTTPVEAPTADTAVFLVLAAMRNFQQGISLTLEGKWPSGGKCAGASLGHDPVGKTVGILGMGGIGRAIRDRLVPFGFKRTVYYNRSRLSPELEKLSEYVSFDELVQQSDVILISVPLNPHTRHLINGKVISSMKDGVVIVNTARGPIIDEAELVPHLKSGKVGAFGSDVFEHEPEVPSELLLLPNVVALPHMGTHTYESIKEMEEFVVENIELCMASGKVITLVPEQKAIF